MSIKAYNRGTEVIRREIDQEISKADEIRAGRILDKMNADMERIEKENETLKADLARAREAYQRRCAEIAVLKEELSTANENTQAEHLRFMDCAAALDNSRKGHEKLTAVMKLALTPEQYHQYRAAAAEVYPELFS